ncbi:hypothetical protein ACI799_17210 [Blastococcus sp. SYSU DS0753]
MPRHHASSRGRRTAAFLTLCAAALAGCGENDEAVADALTRALAEGAESGTTVDLREVVSGDWERLTFVCPYEDESDVTERLGFSWSGFPGTDLSETQVLFVFSRDDGVATWARLPRAAGDPCGARSPVPLTMPREEAVFTVAEQDRTADGGAFYSLVPAPA